MVARSASPVWRFSDMSDFRQTSTGSVATIVHMDFVETLADAPAVWHQVDSPLGELLLVGDGRSLTRLEMPPWDVPAGATHDPDAFADVEAQLGAYFLGERTEFE